MAKQNKSYKTRETAICFKVSKITNVYHETGIPLFKNNTIII